jgi:hypothetical protein
MRRSSKNYAIKTNLMHYFSSVYFDNLPLHVSGIFAAHNREVYFIYTTVGMELVPSQPSQQTVN